MKKLDSFCAFCGSDHGSGVYPDRHQAFSLELDCPMLCELKKIGCTDNVHSNDPNLIGFISFSQCNEGIEFGYLNPCNHQFHY